MTGVTELLAAHRRGDTHALERMIPIVYADLRRLARAQLRRLRPGATLTHARDEVRRFQSRIVARFPWPMPSSWNRDVTAVPLAESLVAGVRSRLLILMAAVAIVLVIACANVANLSLSRAVVREREICIRAAIGAGPRRR